MAAKPLVGRRSQRVVDQAEREGPQHEQERQLFDAEHENGNRLPSRCNDSRVQRRDETHCHEREGPQQPHDAEPDDDRAAPVVLRTTATGCLQSRDERAHREPGNYCGGAEQQDERHDICGHIAHVVSSGSAPSRRASTSQASPVPVYSMISEGMTIPESSVSKASAPPTNVATIAAV